MFGIGTTELLVIIVVGILVLGPEHLPKLMRTVTRVMSDVRQMSTELQRTINLEAHREEWEKKQAEAAPPKKKRTAPAPKGEAASGGAGATPGQPGAAGTAADTTSRDAADISGDEPPRATSAPPQSGRHEHSGLPRQDETRKDADTPAENNGPVPDADRESSPATGPENRA